jgi:hypothetical protein
VPSKCLALDFILRHRTPASLKEYLRFSQIFRTDRYFAYAVPAREKGGVTATLLFPGPVLESCSREEQGDYSGAS